MSGRPYASSYPHGASTRSAFSRKIKAVRAHNLSLLIGLLYFWCAAPSARAQAPQAPPASVIAEIHAAGSTHYSEPLIIAASELKPGDPVTREQLQEAADRLAHLGAFQRVNYQFTSRGNQIVVELQLADAPAFPVTFDNFVWFGDPEIVSAMRGAVPLFNGAAPEEGAMLDEMTSVLTKLLQSRGVQGTVKHELHVLPSRQAMSVQFRVDDPGVTIASLQYGDALAQNSETLRDRNQDLIGKPFSRFTIEVFENEQVLPLYLVAGHIHVQFGEPDAGLRGAPQAKTSSPSGVLVKIPIVPGPVFHFSGVDWSGNSALAAPALTALLPMKPGNLADGMQLMAGWQRAEQEYQRRGYLDVKFDPQPRFDDAAATVTYHVNVAEGPQYRMGELIVTGLSVDAERKLRAAWHQARGDVFDGPYFDALLVKLEKPTPAIFGDIPVHYTEVGHWLRPNTDTHVMDVLIDFK